MRYHEIVKELFANPTRISWEPEHVDAYSSSYKAILPNDAIIRFSASRQDLKRKIWDIAFTINGQFHRFDSGNPSTMVFAAVLECLRTFMNERKPTGLRFAAKGSSRQKLYGVLTKKLAADIGWTVHVSEKNWEMQYFVSDPKGHDSDLQPTVADS
jgi:hypothetical protein